MLPAVASCAAAAAALRTQGREVQLVHPPWFDDEFDALGAAYFRSRVRSLGNESGGFSPMTPPAWSRSTSSTGRRPVEDRAEAIVLAGNRFRAAGAVEELELRTGRIVLAANQALVWGVLAATGTEWDITDYGRLLRARAGTGSADDESARARSTSRLVFGLEVADLP